jgi:hypothetical protein
MNAETDDVAQAANELAAWLPYAAAIIACPDTTGGGIHGKPGSRPPWNPAAANAVFDAIQAVLQLEREMREDVTGRHAPLKPHARTGAALDAITSLANAIPEADRRYVVAILIRHVTTILQLAAIDREERWQKITGAHCPYCGTPMLRFGKQSGRVSCLRLGACTDSNGDHPKGILTTGHASGQPIIAWADGTIQQPPTEENS